jgi:enterochelin esterase-like enzyme
VQRAILPASWRYLESGKRDLRLDLLRGFAVFAMAVDHVGGPSPYHWLSGGNRFFVSAAEGFVAISGVTLGIVYRRSEGRVRAVFARAWSRAWTLYVVSVFLALAFAAAAALARIPKGAPFDADPGLFIRDVVALRRSYYLAEVMLLYTFLLVLTPGIVLLARRGLWWVALGLSLGLWASFQLWPQQMVLPWHITDFQEFPLAAWQILFVAGLTVGWHRDELAKFGRALPKRPLPGGPLLPLGGLTAIMIWLHATNAAVLDRWLGAQGGAQLLDSWFDKASLPLPRLIACVIVFGFAWELVSVTWTPMRKAAGQFLLPLGSSSLYAYSVHVLAACAADIAVFHLHGTGALSTAQSFALQSAMLAIVWVFTRWHLLQPQVRWLGQPPVSSFRGNRLRPAPSMLAVAALFASSGLALAAQGSGGPLAITARPASDARRAAYNNPVTTVTPPRASLKNTVVEPAQGDGGTAVSAQVLAPQFEVVAGTLDESTITSAALGRTMPYAIYLPPSYASQPDRHFPVLYLLHGAGGGYTEWSEYGLPQEAARLMSEGGLDEFIIVMPQGDKSYWANGLTTDGEAWTDYLVDDIVPFIDANYRTIPDRTQRAIGGLSRGGFGSLYVGFTHPELFSIIAANSPSLPGEAASLENTRISEDDFPFYDPLQLAHGIDPSDPPQIWLDIGDSDDWEPAAAMLDRLLTALDIPHEYSEKPGQHVRDYWVSRVDDYLQFYSGAFLKNAAPAVHEGAVQDSESPQGSSDAPSGEDAGTDAG